jgi:homeodomain-containing protein
VKKYKVTLTDEERSTLVELISRGKGPARKLCHARILLKADVSPPGSAWEDTAISEALEIGTATVERVRKRFVEEGFEEALGRKKPRREYERRLDGQAEAHLIALTCSQAPEGRERWTLQLLADRMVVLGHVEAVSRDTIRRTLKKTTSNRG